MGRSPDRLPLGGDNLNKSDGGPTNSRPNSGVTLTLYATVFAGISVAAMSTLTPSLYLDASNLTSEQSRAVDRISIDLVAQLVELKNELRPSPTAALSHYEGLRLLKLRTDRQLQGVPLLRNDPRVAIADSMELLVSGTPDSINDAELIIRSYFAQSEIDPSSNETFLSDNYELTWLSPLEKASVDRVIDEFIGYAINQGEGVAPEEYVETACDRGRRLASMLFPVWNEYLVDATKSDRRKLGMLPDLLKNDYDFTLRLYEKTGDSHYRDIANSVGRRLALLNAVQKREMARVAEILTSEPHQNFFDRL